MTNQGLRQASVRAVTGTALTYEGDWHALFDAAGITAGPFNGRLLAWINDRLGAAYPDLPGAMQAFAESQGAYNWSSMGTFDAGVFEGILDQIASTPAAAWSVSRALKAAWVGEKLCDLRRSSDNGTLSIYAGDDGEADLSGYAAWAGADTIYCSRVYDQSGNAKDWVQATAGSQPKFTLTGPGGLPAIFDDNTRNAAMTMTAGAPVDGMWATGGSSYLAVRVGSDLGGSVIQKGEIRTCQFTNSGATAGYTKVGMTYPWSGAGFGTGFWTTTSATAWPAAEAHIFAIEYSAASSANVPTFYIDGASMAVTSNRPAGGTVGSDTSNLGIFSFATDGQQVSEHVLFAAILSSGDRTLLNDDLTARYSD